MKTWHKILISIGVVVVALAGFLISKAVSRKDEVAINIQNRNLVKSVNDKFNVFEDCGIDINNSDVKPYFISSNIKILTVELLTGNTECLSTGRTNIIVNVKVDEDTTIKKNINIEVKEKSYFATYANFDRETIYLNENLTESVNKLNTDASNVEIKVSYKNSLVEYDYTTGRITSKGVNGSDVVYLKIPKSEAELLEISFNVEIGVKNVKSFNCDDLKVNEVRDVTEYFSEFILNDNITKESFIINNSSIADILFVDFDKIVIKAYSKGETIISYKDALNEINLIISVS